MGRDKPDNTPKTRVATAVEEARQGNTRTEARAGRPAETRESRGHREGTPTTLEAATVQEGVEDARLRVSATTEPKIAKPRHSTLASVASSLLGRKKKK